MDKRTLSLVSPVSLLVGSLTRRQVLDVDGLRQEAPVHHQQGVDGLVHASGAQGVARPQTEPERKERAGGNTGPWGLPKTETPPLVAFCSPCGGWFPHSNGCSSKFGRKPQVSPTFSVVRVPFWSFFLSHTQMRRNIKKDKSLRNMNKIWEKMRVDHKSQESQGTGKAMLGMTNAASSKEPGVDKHVSQRTMLLGRGGSTS